VKEEPIRFWIGVASLDHVREGQKGGYVQLSRGEEIPLKRMQPGDWLVYYSSRQSGQRQEKCQSFTAIARTIDSDVYPFFSPEGFVFFRRNARYVLCHNASILPLVDQLSFIENKRYWGYPFRSGHFEISSEDFQLIAKAMHVEFSEPL
jgi:predicted RNA-binding protein